jgi:excisionase family DNA binding protein
MSFAHVMRYDLGKICAGDSSGFEPHERGEVLAKLLVGVATAAASPPAPVTAPSTPPRLLNAKQAAERLGVDESWVLKKSREGKLPFVPLGRYKRFRPEDLDALFAPRPEDQ